MSGDETSRAASDGSSSSATPQGWSTLLCTRTGRVALEGTERAALEEQICTLIEEAQIAHPGFAVSPEMFVAALAVRVPADGDLQAQLASLRYQDLYLVVGCLEREAGALAALDSLLQGLKASLRRLNPEPVFADEVLQRARERLLLGEAPKLVGYLATGPLASWLRTAVNRVALNLIQERSGEPPGADEEALAGLTAQEDLELELLRERFREPFKRAFATALASLSAEERNLLKFSYLDGLSNEAIARFYRTHRTTITRRLQLALDTLLKRMRQALRNEMGLTASEVESLLGDLRSDPRLSLASMLGARG